MEKSDTGWVPFAITGIVLILLAGFQTGVPTWTNYLSYGFLPGFLPHLSSEGGTRYEHR